MWQSLARGQATAAPMAPPSMPMNAMASTEAVNSRFSRVLNFLKSLEGHREASKEEIFINTGINIDIDDEIREKLQNNEKVRVATNNYAYRAKYEIKTKMDLLRKLKDVGRGIPIAELADCYSTIQDDLTELTRAGDIICIKSQDAAEVYYSRGFKFLTEVSAKATVEYGSYMTTVDANTTEELRRGDCIRIGDTHWFRVSNADKKAGIGNPPQPFTTINPTTQSKSVSSIVDLNIENKSKLKYILPFDAHHIPLDMPYPDPRQGHIHHTKWDVAPKLGKGSGVFSIVKHGCTNDIRELWKKVKDTTWPMDPAALEMKLVQCGLSSGTSMNSQHHRVKFAKKKIKVPRTRKQREIKLTNTHLRDTVLGNILAKGKEGGGEFTLGATKFERQ